jgi:hypothetical protein
MRPFCGAAEVGASAHNSVMENEAWPTPQTPSREPLPRVEDLPLADQGYEQESVRAAFDAFYRHAAQLDASLRTLEAVDSFHRHAAALRSDLRQLRSAGWTQQSWPSSPPSYGYGARAPREGVSPVVWRVAGEVAFLIAAAVALGLANLAWWTILLGMAGALLIVCAIEWAAGRDELTFTQPTAGAPSHPVVEAQRAEDTEEHDALGWTAFEEAQEPSDAMTMIGTAPREEEQPVAEAGEGKEPDPEPETEPEPELPPAAEEQPAAEAKRRWWHRGADEPDEDTAESPEPQAEAPRHVRVLPQDGGDPWEQGFDAPVTAEAAEVGEGDEPDAADESGRRLFRRR